TSTERRATSTERRATSTERRAPSTERRTTSTERRAPSTETRAPLLETRAPTMDVRAKPANIPAGSAVGRDGTHGVCCNGSWNVTRPGRAQSRGRWQAARDHRQRNRWGAERASPHWEVDPRLPVGAHLPVVGGAATHRLGVEHDLARGRPVPDR